MAGPPCVAFPGSLGGTCYYPHPLALKQQGRVRCGGSWAFA